MMADDVVTCWSCQRFFDSRCIDGFEKAVRGTELVTTHEHNHHIRVALEARNRDDRTIDRAAMAAHTAEMASQFPNMTVRFDAQFSAADAAAKDMECLFEWGHCPRCHAQLGVCALPKLAVACLTKKLFPDADMNFSSGYEYAKPICAEVKQAPSKTIIRR